VCCAPGYPESYHKGLPISGHDSVNQKGVKVYFAGSILSNNEESDCISSGGRILSVTGVSTTLSDAVKEAYGGVHKIR
jgi:phosphoribosylamine--glycine ligase